jgi:uncharacterized membrane-anchored protein
MNALTNVLSQRILWIAGLIVALGAVNMTIAGHQKTLSDGRRVLLQTAPVDPRSLMQGDYMALRFAIAPAIADAATKAEITQGHALLSIDDNSVGKFVRLLEKNEAIAANQQKLEFRIRSNGNNNVRIVTDAYFFEEGTGNAFETARFGEFRVNENGTALLTGMLDEKRQRIEPKVDKTIKERLQDPAKS